MSTKSNRKSDLFNVTHSQILDYLHMQETYLGLTEVVWHQTHASSTYTKGHIKWSSNRPIGRTGFYVAVRLVLPRVYERTMWVVQTFAFELFGLGAGPESVSRVGIISGDIVLAHYGKMPAAEEQILHPDESVWKIYNARDLQSLFEAYDRLAVNPYQIFPVFTRSQT